MYFPKNVRIYIYNALFFFFGSILTLSVTQIENNKECFNEKIKEENYKHYKVSKMDNPDLIILIISTPSNFERRQTIRESWLLLPTNNKIKVKHYFVVGSLGLSADTMLHLSSEQSKYNDLVILPMLDKYNNLTYKVLQTFVWLHEQVTYGLNFSFVLKCDDDSFVRIDKFTNDIQTFLSKYTTNFEDNTTMKFYNLNSSIFSASSQTNSDVKRKRHLYWGYFNGNAKIKTKGKWQEKEWMLCDNYLPYALGGGYVVSEGLVKYLAKNANDFKLYNSEDVSVGTWLATVTNIDRIHDIRFDTEWITRGCQNMHLIFHKYSQEEMKSMYKNIRKYGKPCVEETFKRKHYLYNWNTVPSKCCIKN